MKDHDEIAADRYFRFAAGVGPAPAAAKLPGLRADLTADLQDRERKARREAPDWYAEPLELELELAHGPRRLVGCLGLQPGVVFDTYDVQADGTRRRRTEYIPAKLCGRCWVCQHYPERAVP